MYSEKEAAIIAIVSRARRPWMTADACNDNNTIESYYSESQDNINKCCSCAMRECINCLSGVRYERRGKPNAVFDTQKFVLMVREKRAAKTVCVALGITRSTYFKYKRIYMQEGKI